MPETYSASPSDILSPISRFLFSMTATQIKHALNIDVPKGVYFVSGTNSSPQKSTVAHGDGDVIEALKRFHSDGLTLIAASRENIKQIEKYYENPSLFTKSRPLQSR